MEDNINIYANVIQPQFFGKFKRASIFWPMGDKLNSLINGMQPQGEKIVQAWGVRV